MKKSITSMAAKLSATALTAGLFIAPQADAATSIAKYLTNYTLGTPVNTSVQAASWYKPAFGNAGWTHFSKWGQLQLKKGRTYEIVVQSSVAGLHPGLTLWRRQTGKKYVPADFFAGHSYNQYESIEAKNQVDETTGKNLGRLAMFHTINGYDTDGMKGTPCFSAGCAWPTNPSMNGISDGTPGRLVLTFKVKKTGLYQFVTGGINPDDKTETAGGFANNATYHPISVQVNRIK